MKPTKNQIFCPACRRTKMLFESEQAANRFMEFNAEDIQEENGKAPVRAYYCDMCLGWHLTSLADFSEESSIKVIEHRFSALKTNPEKYKAETKAAQDSLNKGSYNQAFDRALATYKKIRREKFFSQEEKQSLFAPLYPILERSLVILIAQLRQSRVTNPEADHHKMVNEVKAKILFLNLNDPGIAALYNKYLPLIDELKGDIKQENLQNLAYTRVVETEGKPIVTFLTTEENLYQLLADIDDNIHLQEYIEAVHLGLHAIYKLKRSEDSKLWEPRETIKSGIYKKVLDALMGYFTMVDKSIESMELDEASQLLSTLRAALEDFLKDPRPRQVLAIFNESQKLIDARFARIEQFTKPSYAEHFIVVYDNDNDLAKFVGLEKHDLVDFDLGYVYADKSLSQAQSVATDLWKHRYFLKQYHVYVVRMIKGDFELIHRMTNSDKKWPYVKTLLVK